MTNGKDPMKEMEDSFARVRLEEEDDGGLTYEESCGELSDIDTRWCLVGRFLTEATIDFQAIQHKLASLWRPEKGMYVKELERNRYIFQFYHEVDIARVIEGSPWTFGRFHLVFERLKEGDDPRMISINKLDLWVQLHGMSKGFMSQKVVMDVGNHIGNFVESDPNNFVGVWRDYFRVRVTTDLSKPLKRRMKLRRSTDSWCWVNFKYEGVPTFCFICGLIGHGEKFCEKIFEIPLEQIERPYGSWMKAEPRRRSHTIGAKWLRQGNKFPAKVQTEEKEDGSSKQDGVIVAKEVVSSGFSGDLAVMGAKQNMVRVGENQGKHINLGEDYAKIITAGNLNVVGRESSDVNDVRGLLVIDSKRRRIEEPILNGPMENQFAKMHTWWIHMTTSTKNQKTSKWRALQCSPARHYEYTKLELPGNGATSESSVPC